MEIQSVFDEKLFSTVRDQRATGTCSCTRFQHFIKPLNPQPFAQCLYIWGQYINRGKNKVTKYPSIKIIYTGNYLFL